MSANLVRLRKRAAELEQKKQFDRALEVYVQILDEGGKDLDDEDVPLFNRVGDMLMRKGNVTEALGYYERAVDMYAERGYLNNAIALCSKILRQSPGRAAVYYKLARISARKGFKSDARKNFLEYADRMQKLGMADEAFRALKEFASLYPDQDDVRLILAELLSKENRKGEALEQLQSLYEKLQAEGRGAEARATVDRMRAIDPEVTPREGLGRPTPAAVGDLVFLDLNDAESTPTTPREGAQPPSARAPMASPVPALDGLSITFFPDEKEAEAPRPDGFESTAVESEPVETTPVTRSLTPLGSELVVEPVKPERPSQRNVTPIVPLDLMNDAPEPLERIEQALEDLAPVPESTSRPPSWTPPPLSSYEFATIDLDETPQAPAARGHNLSLPGELPVTPEDVESVPAPMLESPAAAEDARTAAEEAAELVADIAAREAGPQPIPAEWEAPAPDVPNEPELPAITDAVLEGRLKAAPLEDIPDDFMSMPPSFGAPADSVDDHAFPPLPGLDDVEILEADGTADAPDQPPAVPATTAHATISIGSAEGHLRSRLELDPENWDLRRQLGEALLDTGDRDGGLYELELAMTGFDLRGHADRAQEIVDVILKVSPSSISHHQKRVEYAVRSRDRGRLAYAYLELADALFRSGAADKAVAVYGRVLELDPGNERAEFALTTLAPDELVRLRGGPKRPARWSEELATIDAGAKPPASPSPASPPEPSTAAAPDTSRNGAELPMKEVYPPPPRSQRVRFTSLELPVPEWGEGVPVRGSAPRSPAAPPPPPIRKEQPVHDPRPHVAPEPEPIAFDPESIENELLPIAGEAEPTAREPKPIAREPEPIAPEPAHVAPELVEEPDPVDILPDEEPAYLSHAQAYELEPSAPGEDEGMRADESRGSLTPTSVPEAQRLTPVGTPRSATPRSVPTPRSPTPPPHRVHRDPTPTAVPSTRTYTVPSPLDDSDSEFIDLGEWLRNTEPVRSTRMQVEDPKPTGDEQADFQEMLRRFKRGVAENVEAEDYEAHYDLGVAYKEMGLIDEAIAQFQKALRDPNQRVRSYEALGQCFVEKEQYPIAAALLQRATEVPGSDDQQLVGVLYLLGFATEHLGRPADALPYYLRVFAVDIEFRDVAERVAALGKTTK